MSISIRNIPNYEELLDYIPESQYTKNAITSARRVSRLNPLEPIAATQNFSSNLDTEFKIAASQSNLLNLAECYFTICGTLNTTTPSTIQQYLKAGPLWILKAINKLSLDIGGVNVYSLDTPSYLAKYTEIFNKNYNDLTSGTYELEGFAPHVDGLYNTTKNNEKNQYFPFTMNSNLHSKTTSMNNTNISYFDTFSDTSVTLNELPINFNKNAIIWDEDTKTYKFFIILRLCDIFPINDLKPIFGQDVRVRIQFSAKGYTGILAQDGSYPIISQFSQFYLNVITYTINVDMIQKLNNVYSKQVVEIIDDISYNLQGVVGISGNNQIDIYVPIKLQFEPEMIYICLPHAPANNTFDNVITPPLYLADVNNGNFIAHTPMDYRFFDINRIVVEADGEILYTKSYDDFKTTPTFSSNEIHAVSNKSLTASNSSGFKNYLTAYNDYKECRYYHGQTEEAALPFNEWIYSGFGIAIPTRAFSRLTTGCNLRISITFGDNITNNVIVQPGGDIAGNLRLMSYSTGTPIFQLLNQFLIIQKSSKALVFNGFNSCSIKSISQSFEQDIYVENKTDEVTPQ